MKILDIQQNTDAWDDLRRNHLGASDIAILMTGSKSEIYELYLSKTIGKKKFVTDAMKRGTGMEAEAREWFNRKGYDFKPTVAESDEHPWLMASFDGYDAVTNSILEIKCPGDMPESVEQHKNYSRWWWQVQAQYAVSGVEKAFLLAYDPSIQVWSYVAPNEEAIASLIERGVGFWQRVMNFDPPEEEVENRDDHDAVKAITEWNSAKTMLDVAKKREEEARVKIVEVANGKSFACNGVTVKKLHRVGNIDYSKIPELKDVDLEKYRKPGSEYWKIS